MSRAPYTKGRGFRTATIVTGLSIILITGIFDVTISFALFPVFAFFLFLYLFKATNSVNGIFLSFLLLTMLSEILFLIDYQKYVNYATLFSGLSNVLMLLLIRPAIPKEYSTFSKHNIIELIIGFIGVGVGLGYLIYSLIPLVPNIFIFMVGLLSFLVAAATCFTIPNINRHPDNSLLWGIGGAYIAEMSFAFVHQFISNDILFLLASIFMGCFVKIVLATYLARIEPIKKYDNNKGIN